MMRIFLSVLFFLFLYEPTILLGASQKSELFTPVQVVATFQKLPGYEMFCQDEEEEGTEPVKVGVKFESYFSNELYKLFLWSQCVEPESPPHYVEIHAFYWDIRFGNGLGYGGTYPAKNIRIRLVKKQDSGTALVNVIYDFGTLKNLVTTYTLIREDGHWKIDDIAPQGYGTEMEEILRSSASIKTDMQNNYRAAEKRYQEEQAKKH